MHTKWYISVLLVLSNLEGACNRVLDQMLFSPLTVFSKHTCKSFVSEYVEEATTDSGVLQDPVLLRDT